MKKIIITLLFITISANIFAMCGDRGLWFFPENQEIKQNSWIMITAYSMSQEVVNKLNTKYPVYLQAGRHKVKLTIVSRQEGMFSQTQVILKPEKQLKKGKTYHLKIDNLKNGSEDDEFSDWAYEIEEINKKTWTVVNETDTEAPVWNKKPKFKETLCDHFGCGPALYAIFNCEIKDDSEVLIKTEFTNLKTNETTIYYLTADNKEIKIGHGMCSGAFSFGNEGENKKFSVKFALLDASGNELNKYTKPIKFNHPYKEPEF